MRGEKTGADARTVSPAGDDNRVNLRCVSGLWFRDLRLLVRAPAQSLLGAQLFLLICLLLPLSISADPSLLREAGNGLIWVAALLASLLGVNSLLRQDLADGGCHALLCSPCPLVYLVLAKLCAHWVVVAVPVLILAPVVGWSYGFESRAVLWLSIALLLTTPVISAISMMAVIFSSGVRGGDLLAAAIAIPFFLPVAVVGADAVAHAHWNREVSAHLLFMAGLLILALALAPWAIAASLRLSYENR